MTWLSFDEKQIGCFVDQWYESYVIHEHRSAKDIRDRAGKLKDAILLYHSNYIKIPQEMT